MPTYHKGLLQPPNLAHLRHLSLRRNKDELDALPRATEPSWDSVALGWVPPVKDQGQCGSCWNFSGTGVVEIAYWKAGLKHVFSEEYTMCCGRNGGCNGDDNTTVLEWAKKTGLPLSADYGPYTARSGRCNFKPGMTLYKIDDWGFADKGQGQGVTDVQDIKDAIKAYGCVGCAIAADGAFMNNPPGSVFDRTTSRGIDHDVILVGWDDSRGSKGAWKLRNSWGANSCLEGEDDHKAVYLDVTWCDGGYCWIGYGVNLVGTEAVWAKVNAAAPPIDFSSL